MLGGARRHGPLRLPTGPGTPETPHCTPHTHRNTHTHAPQGRWLENPPRPVSTMGTLRMMTGATTAPAPTVSQSSISTSGSACLLHGSFVLVPAAARLETHREASPTEAVAQAGPKSSPDGRELTGTPARARRWASPPSTTPAPAGTGLLHTTTGVTNFWSHVIRQVSEAKSSGPSGV